MKFQYRIFNLSEVVARQKTDKSADLVLILNEYGLNGWEVVFRLTDYSFLLKRRTE